MNAKNKHYAMFYVPCMVHSCLIEKVWSVKPVNVIRLWTLLIIAITYLGERRLIVSVKWKRFWRDSFIWIGQIANVRITNKGEKENIRRERERYTNIITDINT